MKRKIIVYERLEQPVLESLQKDFNVHFFKNIDPKKDPAFLKVLQEAEGIIGVGFPADGELLDLAPHVRIISNVSVGYNNLDLKEMTKRNIMATNTPGVLDDTVADLVIGLMLSAARRLPELDKYVKDGMWKESLPSEYYGVDVHHKTLGIIGMGRIGSAIAHRAYHGFHMNILYNSRRRKPEAEEKFKATYKDLDSLLKASDFVCLITPLTKETEGLMGKEQFQLMKRSAIFINASRGKTVVESDLIEALKNKEILAAGLDVFEQEPIDPNNELLNMPNVVTLPHIGSSTHETELKMSRLAEKNLRAGLNGEKPKNLLNKEVFNDQSVK